MRLGRPHEYGAGSSAWWLTSQGYKREQYIFLVIIYGALCLPAAGLTVYNLSNYYGFIWLYTIFGVVGYLVIAWGNIFIPYTMQAAAPIEDLSAQARLDALDKIDGEGRKELRAKREMEGLKISVGGTVALNVAVVLFNVITIGISYATMDAQKNAGLYMTTVSGAVCIICALLGWPFLPSPAPIAYEGRWWLLPFTVCEFGRFLGQACLTLLSCQPVERYQQVYKRHAVPRCLRHLQRLPLRL